MLEEEFTEVEVFDGLNLCNGSKATGPDGFNVKFLQRFWYLFKDGIMGIFKEFHSSEKFVKSLNTTFLTLIPKKKGN